MIVVVSREESYSDAPGSARSQASLSNSRPVATGTISPTRASAPRADDDRAGHLVVYRLALRVRAGHDHVNDRADDGHPQEAHGDYSPERAREADLRAVG